MISCCNERKSTSFHFSYTLLILCFLEFINPNKAFADGLSNQTNIEAACPLKTDIPARIKEYPQITQQFQVIYQIQQSICQNKLLFNMVKLTENQNTRKKELIKLGQMIKSLKTNFGLSCLNGSPIPPSKNDKPQDADKPSLNLDGKSFAYTCKYTVKQISDSQATIEAECLNVKQELIKTSLNFDPRQTDQLDIQNCDGRLQVGKDNCSANLVDHPFQAGDTYNLDNRDFTDSCSQYTAKIDSFNHGTIKASCTDPASGKTGEYTAKFDSGIIFQNVVFKNGKLQVIDDSNYSPSRPPSHADSEISNDLQDPKLSYNPKPENNNPPSSIDGTNYSEECQNKSWQDVTSFPVHYQNNNTQGDKIFQNLLPDPTQTIHKVMLDVLKTLYHNPCEAKRINSINIMVDTTDAFAYFVAGKIVISQNALVRMGNGDHSQNVYDLVGVLVHETTHGAQHSGSHEPAGFIEGVADAVRILTGYHKYRLRHKGGNYTDGYTTTGFFLVWIQNEKGIKNFVHDINQIPRKRKNFSWEQAISDATGGNNVQDLWNEYQAWLSSH